MLNLPPEIMLLLQAFMPVFSERTWDWIVVLVMGAILAPGKRTVTAILAVMGLSQEKQYQRYHRVLNRAQWSSLAVAKILLGLLVSAFVLSGQTVVLGADETLERRKGKHIKARGVFRDSVRSSKKHIVKSFGLRWISLMLLVPVPWSQRVWALPFLTVLAPSEKTNQANGKRHKTSVRWIGQMIAQVRRWRPGYRLVLVVDGGLAAIKLGHQCNLYEVTYVSRLRLDAGLYDFPGEQPQGKRGRKPQKGKKQPTLKQRLTDPATVWQTVCRPWYGGQVRQLDIATGVAVWYSPRQKPLPLRWVLVRDPLGKLDPAAFFATDRDASPQQILQWVVMRWNVEVTFQEVRAHLGVETQRQWSDLAIERTTPALLGLFSFITLLAHRLTRGQPLPTQSTAWYHKREATFSDVLAFVRHHLWTHPNFMQSPFSPKPASISQGWQPFLVDLLAQVT